PAPVALVIHTDQVFFFHGKLHCHTSNSCVFSRCGGFFCCSSLAALSCARMDGFFCFCAGRWGCLGFRASALAASATSNKEICSPALALASSSLMVGALFRTPSIML